MDDRSMHCALFPVNRGFDYVVQCSHVVMVPFSASLWYSDRMKDVVPNDVSLEHVRLFKFIMQMALTSDVDVHIETVYDSALRDCNIDFVSHYRLWVVFQNADKKDIFCDHMATFFAQRVEQITKEKAKRRKTSYVVPLCDWGEMTQDSMVHSITRLQGRNLTNSLIVTFESATESEDEEPETHFIRLVGARNTLDGLGVLWDEWGVSEERRQFETYVDADESGNMTFKIPEEDAALWQPLNGHGIVNWIKDANRLTEGIGYCLPNIKPSRHDKIQYLIKMSSTNGMPTAGISMMTDDALDDAMEGLQQGAHIGDPLVRDLTQDVGAAETWSDSMVKATLPVQHEQAMAAQTMMTSALTSGVPAQLVERIDKIVIRNTERMIAPGIQCTGFPSSYSRVLQANIVDVSSLSNTINKSANPGMASAAKNGYFPDKTGNDDMSWHTFFIATQCEFFRHDAGFSPQQCIIAMAAFSILQICDHPGFGVLYSLMACGPPGMGKSYIFKIMQEIANTGKFFKCNDFSKEAMAYPGMIEQVMMVVDEFMHANSKTGTTGTLQSAMVDGTIFKSRADAELKKTINWKIAVRFAIVTATNKYCDNEALLDRFAKSVVTGTGAATEKHEFARKSDYYTAACTALKCLSGRSSAIWLFVMNKQLAEANTDLFEIFCAIHIAIFEDSPLGAKPRLKQLVENMAKAKSVEMMISLYERREAKELTNLYNVDFLAFLRTNWIIDPYSIWFAMIMQLKGIDPNAANKTLSFFKDNIKMNAQNQFVRDQQTGKYFMTTVAVGGPQFVAGAKVTGLGEALFEQQIAELSQKNGMNAAAIAIDHSSRTPLYMVHTDALASMRTLCKAEKMIIDFFASKMHRAHISADLQSYVFPTSVRSMLMKQNTRPDNLRSLSDEEFRQSLEWLSTSLGLCVYDPVDTLQSPIYAEIAVPAPLPVPDRIAAVPGSLLDPDFEGDKYYTVGTKMAEVALWDAEKYAEYMAIKSGNDPIIAEKKRKEETVISYAVSACGGIFTDRPDAAATESEKIFDGIGPDGNVEFIEIENQDTPLKIRNPFYKKPARRISRSTEEFSEERVVDTSSEYLWIGGRDGETNLAAKLTELMAKRHKYGVADRVYKPDNTGFY